MILQTLASLHSVAVVVTYKLKCVLYATFSPWNSPLFSWFWSELHAYAVRSLVLRSCQRLPVTVDGHLLSAQHTPGRSSRIFFRTPVSRVRNQFPPILSILKTFRFEDRRWWTYNYCLHSDNHIDWIHRYRHWRWALDPRHLTRAPISSWDYTSMAAYPCHGSHLTRGQSQITYRLMAFNTWRRDMNAECTG